MNKRLIELCQNKVSNFKAKTNYRVEVKKAA